MNIISLLVSMTFANICVPEINIDQILIKFSTLWFILAPF